MNKKGITLVEIVVAMAIFVTLMTLTVGAFTTVSRMKTLTATMRETQQKLRLSIEMISRLSRQADKVEMGHPDATNPDRYRMVTLYFPSTNGRAIKFWIIPDTMDQSKAELYYSNCSSIGGVTCPALPGWSTPVQLTGGNLYLKTAETYFEKNGKLPPSLTVKLNGIIANITNNPYYSNEFKLNTKIILESIK